MELIFKLAAKLPLRILHAFGMAMGWAAYALSSRYRERFLSNAAKAGLSPKQIRPAIGHAGKMVAELPRLWFGPPVPVEMIGAEHIDQAHDEGRGIIFLTPHLGCFEITAQAYAQRYQCDGRSLSVLFSPTKKTWLADLVAHSRDRPGLSAVPASLAGIRNLLKALRSGQAIGILPDQVPSQGLGTWASFFGAPAFTMTLPAKLKSQTGSRILFAWGERLPHGRGYKVHLCPTSNDLSGDVEVATQQINCELEKLIRDCPQQYLWGYARYKQPKADQPTGSGVSK